MDFLVNADTKAKIDISVKVHCINLKFYSATIVNKMIFLLVNREYCIIYQDITFSSL